MTTTWQAYVDEHLPAATTPAERTAAIQGALDLVPAQVSRGLTLPRITLPWAGDVGVYELEADANGVCLRLEHPTHLDLGGCALLVPFGTVGIVVPLIAEGSRIEGGTIAGVTQAGWEADPDAGTGVRVEAVFVALRDLTVTDLGIGVQFYGVGATGANADFAYAERVISRRNSTGMHLSTGDVQGGTFLGCVFHQGGVGVHNESFFGNAFVGPAFHTLKREAILTTTASPRDTWIGVAIEADCGSDLPGGAEDCVSNASSYATWIGGCGFPYVHTGDRVGLGLSSVGFRESLPGGDYVEVAIPHGSANAAMTIQRKHADGSFVEAHRWRWLDALQRFGMESFDSHPTATGYRMAYAVTSKAHARGIGRPIHNATPDDAGEILPKKEAP